MSDEVIAGIARDLAVALVTRARTRLPEDQKKVLELQTVLCAEVYAETREPNDADPAQQGEPT